MPGVVPSVPWPIPFVRGLIASGRLSESISGDRLSGVPHVQIRHEKPMARCGMCPMNAEGSRSCYPRTTDSLMIARRRTEANSHCGHVPHVLEKRTQVHGKFVNPSAIAGLYVFVVVLPSKSLLRGVRSDREKRVATDGLSRVIRRLLQLTRWCICGDNRARADCGRVHTTRTLHAYTRTREVMRHGCASARRSSRSLNTFTASICMSC
jgi:hypothetical protein